MDPNKWTRAEWARFGLLFLEALAFGIFLVSAILTIVELLTLDWYYIVDFLVSPLFLTTLITGIIFLILPALSVYFRFHLERVDKRVREKRFAANLLKMLRRSPRLNILNACAKYDVAEPVVRQEIERRVEKGELAGEIRKGVFVLKPGFEIMSKRERRVHSLRANLTKYIQPYRSVGLDKIAKAFKVPLSVVEHVVKEALREHKIRGFLDEYTLYREISSIALDFTDLPECPYCDNKVLDNAIYCSTCGRKIAGDDTTPGEAAGEPPGNSGGESTRESTKDSTKDARERPRTSG